ncbi:lactate racemase domain-containing protein [Chloroflexota bacterium]
MQYFRVPQLAWYDPKELELFFPDGWDMAVCHIAGYDRPALSDEQIKSAIASPIAMPTIREAARGKKDAVIIFDDMARVTRVAKIVPHILAELASAGIEDSHIRFICALGSHGPLDRIDLIKKLGADVVGRYMVYNHHAFSNCVHVGTSSFGTEILLNAEFMSCDFKIAIGCTTPHPAAIFSGGGKIVLPGVAHFDCITANHTLPITREQENDYDNNPRRLEKEEAAKMAGLDVLVEAIVNLWGESCALYAGTEPEAHAAAVADARAQYVAPKAINKDIVIANAYAKSSEAGASIKMSSQSVKQSGGDLVLIANAPGGQVPHYLLGRWGKKAKTKMKAHIPATPHINHIIRYNEYPDKTTAGRDGQSNWADTIDFLKRIHGDKAQVALYPSADIMCFG